MLKNITGSIALAMLTASGASSAQGQEQHDNYRHLFMAGGGLELCSSFRSNQCDDADWIDNETMRTDRYIDLSSKSLEKVTSDRYWSAYRKDAQEEVKDALQLIHERINEDRMSERVFEREFTRRATLPTYNMLSDAEYAKIIDLLEVTMSSDLPEVVDVDESLNKKSAEIYRRLIEFTRQNVEAGEQPLVYFSTAGDRDPYAKIDFYRSTFEQLGADARWLPLDSAVVKARAENRCEELNEIQQEVQGAYDRDRVYRDYYQQQVAFCKAGDTEYEMLNDADALFLTGSEQDLIRNTFVQDDNSATDLLRMIVARVQQKKLLVGGTSAGTTVMTSKPVISNGTTASAITDGGVATNPPPYGCDLDNTCPQNTGPDTLTYHPFGGLGLFHFASLDTHFSERGRHGRLMRLAADSSTPLSIGIDENTAMLTNLEKGSFDIIGERGVFFVENAQGTPNAVASTFHYLVSGASGMISPFGLQTAEFAEGENIVQAEPTTNYLTDRGFIDSMRVLCGERTEMTLLNKEYRLVAQLDDSSRTASAGGECQIINGKLGIAHQPEEAL